VLEFEVKPGLDEDVLRAYSALRDRLSQGVPGLTHHELCQNVDDPSRWIITSEWDDLESSAAWDRSHEHDALVTPLRKCFAGASSTKYTVRNAI